MVPLTALHGGIADRDPTTLPSFAALFEAVADAIPDLLAVNDGVVTMTFRGLERRSAAIAAAVQRHAPADAAPVAVLAGCDAPAVATDLGVIRSGRPIVVLDRVVPVARMQAILEIAGATLLLADDAHRELAASVIDGTSVELLSPDELIASVPGSADASPAPVDPESLAVIIFTSGSTGTPKGVMWTQRFMTADALAGAGRYDYQPGERAVTSFPISFTGGMLACMVMLVWGASLHMCDPRVVGAPAFLDWIRSTRATIVSLTPSMLRGLLRIIPADEVLGDIRILSTGGEALYSTDVDGIRPHLRDDALFVQGFGSSEAGSVTGIAFARTDPVPDGAVPVGYVTTWRSLRVVDEDGATLGSGTSGELVVTTKVLASGYWREPEKSAARFVRRDDGYWDLRTGDMALLEDDGLLRILGRSEAAVKVRGYLVDPSEVEATLLASGRVAETVVVAVTEDTVTKLIAYFVPKPNQRTASIAELRAFLGARLPSWMVPTHIVPLRDLPRNAGGKIDRVGLPPVPPRVYVAPITEAERRVASIWAEVLNADEPVGRTDDFYELGGDSLLAEEMLARIEDTLHVSLSASDFTQATTLADFAERIGGAPGKLPAPSWPGTTVVLRRGTSGRTIFCVAGGAQSSVAFAPLTSLLDSDDSVVVFLMRGFERRAPAEWTVTGMARGRIAAMRRMQPSGPYVIVGHSLGAVVAQEMAHQLETQGERALAVIVDPSFGLSLVPERHSHKLLDALVEPYWGLDDWRLEVWRRAKFGVRLGMVGLAGLLPRSVDAKNEVMFRRAGMVLRWHRPRPLQSPALAYRTAANKDPEGLWERLMPGARIHEVPSDHNSILRSPYVEQVAADLREALAAV